MSATVVRTGPLDMQVCIPKNWTDEQAVTFAEEQNPCGTTGGWGIRKQGDKLLLGCDERVQCSDKKDFVHIMLDA